MTKDESSRVVAAKEGPCIACLVWSRTAPFPFFVTHGCDYHHLLSGSRRRGHRYGIALCYWHHRAGLDFGSIAPEMRTYYGPSLMDGSKRFHEAYGSDEELLAIQDELLQGAN